MGQTRKNSSGKMKSNFAQGLFNFSPSDSASIFSIASLCPALGGKAVYKARSLYVLWSIYHPYGIYLYGKCTVYNNYIPSGFDGE